MDTREFKKKNDLSILLTKIRILSMMTYKFFCDHPEIEEKVVIDTLSQAYCGVNQLIDGLIENSNRQLTNQNQNKIEYKNEEWAPQEVAFLDSLNDSALENESKLSHKPAMERNFRYKDRVDDDNYEYKTNVDPDYVYDLTEMQKRAISNPPKDGKVWRKLPTFTKDPLNKNLRQTPAWTVTHRILQQEQAAGTGNAGQVDINNLDRSFRSAEKSTDKFYNSEDRLDNPAEIKRIFQQPTPEEARRKIEDLVRGVRGHKHTSTDVFKDYRIPVEIGRVRKPIQSVPRDVQSQNRIVNKDSSRNRFLPVFNDYGALDEIRPREMDKLKALRNSLNKPSININNQSLKNKLPSSNPRFKVPMTRTPLQTTSSDILQKIPHLVRKTDLLKNQSKLLPLNAKTSRSRNQMTAADFVSGAAPTKIPIDFRKKSSVLKPLIKGQASNRFY